VAHEGLDLPATVWREFAYRPSDFQSSVAGWEDAIMSAKATRVARPFAWAVQNWPLLYFGLSVLLFVFALGVAVARFEIFPFGVLAAAWSAALDWRENWRAYLRERPDQMIEAARFDGDGVTTYRPDKASAGVTLISGLWQGRQGIRLVSPDGTVLHEWRVSFNQIWPDAPQLDDQPHDWDSYIHGMILYPNGDLVFNFDYKGLVRMDKCGHVIWQLADQTHHSVFADGRGNLWVGVRRWLPQPPENLRFLSAPFPAEFIVEISPDGEVLREISLIDVIVNSGYESILFANGRDVVGKWGDDGHREMHMNDIEVLDAARADQFPLFEEGDIMVSLRNLNWIVVIDPDSERIKWSKVGPYIRQHDPDFLENGNISVFDNRMDGAGGAVLGGSRIVEVNPVTHAVSTLYQSDARNFFYTDALGKHQHLPNGSILITEGEAGRAFEVTLAGEVVWSYINRWDDDEVAWIEEATRYPMRYAAFTGEECR
jgi:Arylsulfotransferase (ASST)